MTNLQDLADELLENETGPKPPVATVWSNGLRRRRRHTLRISSIVGAAVIVAAIGAASLGRSSHTISVTAEDEPTTEAIPASMQAALDANRPVIAEPLLTQLRDDTNAAADCMSAHGFGGMPRLPDTYGDGNTPAGNLDVRSNLAEAQFTAALPFCTDQIEGVRRDTLASNGLPYEPLAPDTSAPTTP